LRVLNTAEGNGIPIRTADRKIKYPDFTACAEGGDNFEDEAQTAADRFED
jgi:hypothetical protein